MDMFSVNLPTSSPVFLKSLLFCFADGFGGGCGLPVVPGLGGKFGLFFAGLGFLDISKIFFRSSSML